MKLKVLSPFIDKLTGKELKPNETIEVDEKRANQILLTTNPITGKALAEQVKEQVKQSKT